MRGIPALEVNDLSALLAIWKLQSFSRAAEKLGLGQPTLSKKIAYAEATAGFPVFDRTKRPIMPTPRGLALLQRIELAVDILQGSPSGSVHGDSDGIVSVAAAEDLTSSLILGAAVAYRRNFQRAALRVVPADWVTAYQLLEEEKVEIAVVRTAPRNEALEFEPIFLFERVLLVPRGHVLEAKQAGGITWGDIAAFPLILTSPRMPIHSALEAELTKHAIPYRISLEVNSLHLVTKAIALGLGVTVIGNTSVLMEDQTGITSISLSHLLPRDVGGLAYRRGRFLSEPARAFIAAFKDFCQNRTGLPPATHTQEMSPSQ